MYQPYSTGLTGGSRPTSTYNSPRKYGDIGSTSSTYNSSFNGNRGLQPQNNFNSNSGMYPNNSTANSSNLRGGLAASQGQLRSTYASGYQSTSSSLSRSVGSSYNNNTNTNNNFQSGSNLNSGMSSMSSSLDSRSALPNTNRPVSPYARNTMTSSMGSSLTTNRSSLPASSQLSSYQPLRSNSSSQMQQQNVSPVAGVLQVMREMSADLDREEAQLMERLEAVRRNRQNLQQQYDLITSQSGHMENGNPSNFSNSSSAMQVISSLNTDRYNSNPASSALAARSLPKLTRAGYSYFPNNLHEYLESDLRHVRGFGVVQNEFGCIQWDNDIDVRNLNLDEIVEFRSKAEFSLYPHPESGDRLNQSAIVTFFGMFPEPGSTAESVRSQYVQNCAANNFEFLEYSPETGNLSFRVRKFY